MQQAKIIEVLDADVLGSADIASMMSLEEERIKLTGCADDSCLAEIGGALGVQLLASAAIGSVGEKFVVTVKVLDVNEARVLDRVMKPRLKASISMIAACIGGIRQPPPMAMIRPAAPSLASSPRPLSAMP